MGETAISKDVCSTGGKNKNICRGRGGESCAFDGAMIVLQPIADAAHLVHGPISCCGNSWEGRGTLSTKGGLHRMGFTTDMNEFDIVYGSEEKLFRAILDVHAKTGARAVFVYSTCVSGLIGEDLESVCKKAEGRINSGSRGKGRPVKIIPVNAPGFIGPKNFGNRMAGEVLLEHVIGTGRAEDVRRCAFDINLIGEYNIAGDLWLVEPLLKEAGINIMSRITGDSTFEEITHAHEAGLNVIVCGRALINVAQGMERRYGIPYVEASFFGMSETGKALRAIAGNFGDSDLSREIENIIRREEDRVSEKLKKFPRLPGSRAVLYTGGVKSWSLISALQDLGMSVVAVGTKKSTLEDEQKMKKLLGPDALLVEDVAPKNLLRLIRENGADILVAGGRNQYLAMKEGFPFIDVNQERHRAYAGYEGLLNLAEDIDAAIGFFKRERVLPETHASGIREISSEAVINPLKHSQSVGAAIAFQGIDRALPVIHGAQGCTFLAKVLLTKHFREPIALAGSKLFTEEVVMGGGEKLASTIRGFIEKQGPDVIGVLTSGLSEVRGEDVEDAIGKIEPDEDIKGEIVHVPAPDYEGGLESGYARAVERILQKAAGRGANGNALKIKKINVLAGPCLTPADFTELREIVSSFGLNPVLVPDLSALDGSRRGFSPLAEGGTRMQEIRGMGSSVFTLAIGALMGPAARSIEEKFGIPYEIFASSGSLEDTDALMRTLSKISGRQMPEKYARQRDILIDTLRDAHFYYKGKKICTALEPGHTVQVARALAEAGVKIELAVIPQEPGYELEMSARQTVIGDLMSIEGDFDLMISSSHGEETAKRLGVPLYQTGFPVYKKLGGGLALTIGYRGGASFINEVANMLMGVH